MRGKCILIILFFLNIIEPSRFFSRNRNIKKLYFITNGKLRVLKKKKKASYLQTILGSAQINNIKITYKVMK